MAIMARLPQNRLARVAIAPRAKGFGKIFFKDTECGICNDHFDDIDEQVCPDQSPSPVTDCRRKDIDDQDDKGTNDRPDKNADQGGEIEVHSSKERDADLEDHKSGSSTECGQGYHPVVWFFCCP